MADADPALARLAAQFEIRDVLSRYVRGVDRCDWDLVRSCYAPEALDDHGAYAGGVEGLLAWMVERHSRLQASMHLITNVYVEFVDDDRALCESYVVTIQRPTAEWAGAALAMYEMDGLDIPDDHLLESEVRCRFVDRFARQGSWRIEHRTVVFETLHHRLVPKASPFGAGWARSARDTTDPLFAARAGLGLLDIDGTDRSARGTAPR